MNSVGIMCVPLFLSLVTALPINPLLMNKHIIPRTSGLCSGDPCSDILSNFCPNDTHTCVFSRKKCEVSCQPNELPGNVSTNKLNGHEGLFPVEALYEILFLKDPHSNAKNSNTRDQKLNNQSGSLTKLINQTHGTHSVG